MPVRQTLLHRHLQALFALSGPAISLLISASPAIAADAVNAGNSDAPATLQAIEVVGSRTRSAVALSGQEVQTILPGTNPIKALEALPGVSFQTADPWGNNEQNSSLFIHGFSTQQLGYTLDGIPLGDQQYGNYNGLSPQRAVTSENVRSVVLSSGAGDLSTASTSNLGGTIETFSSDPRQKGGFSMEQTLGSYSASRTFARYDTGALGTDLGSAYVSFLRQDAQAWDFAGQQRGQQVNAKYVNELAAGRLTAYFNYNTKVEPNEDSTSRSPTTAYQPYTRPFFYPDFASYLRYLDPVTSATPAAEGNNYRNYYSAAQRTDWLGYVKFDWTLNEHMHWSNQAYYHRDDGAGLVAGPIGVAGLPQLFGVYFPGQNLKQIFGNSGVALRTTEYNIHRGGLLSQFEGEFGEHTVQAGAWYEHNDSSAYRRWYGFDVNNPSTPYDRPSNPLITQYGSQIVNNVVQLNLSDSWKMRPDLTIQAGVKSSLQSATGTFPVQQKPGAVTPLSPALPEGSIDSNRWFLPQLGAVYDLSSRDQLYANVQKNLRQFVTYGAGGLSPWSLGGQAAFDLFKSTVQPETAITFETGYRGRRNVDNSVLTEIDGQINLYHVNFRDRQLQIASTPVVNTINPGSPILANVGSVQTDGIDIAGTLRFGKHYSFYNALSYNRSVYGDDYTAGASGASVPTKGKQVPGSPQWLEKFIFTATYGPVETQLIGDYVGKRYATYTNDQSVSGYFLGTLAVNVKVPLAPDAFVHNARVRLTVSNLTNEKGNLNVVVGSPTNSYATYPIPPRQVFMTVGGDF